MMTAHVAQAGDEPPEEFLQHVLRIMRLMSRDPAKWPDFCEHLGIDPAEFAEFVEHEARRSQQ
jgi:hypothetical protein